MSSEGPPEIPSVTEGAEKPYFKTIVEGAIGPEKKVAWTNEEAFEAGTARYLFGFGESESHESDVFLKMAKIGVENTSEGLRHESKMARAVQELGIPSARLLQEYQEKDGFCFIGFEKLDLEQGEFLANNELIASAPAEYGTMAGKVLYEASGKEIPEGFDMAPFKEGDSRNQSMESFLGSWQESVQKVLDFDPNKQDVLTPEEIVAARKLTKELQDEMMLLQSQKKNDGKKYFVHNDASPNNIFFDLKKGEALLLDFEYAGITENKLLAQVTDFGNFYAKLWPNPALRKSFLKAIMEEVDMTSLDEVYRLARTVVGYGSMFHAHYVIDPQHQEHFSAHIDMDDMFDNIKFLEELYNERGRML